MGNCPTSEYVVVYMVYIVPRVGLLTVESTEGISEICVL